MASHPERPRHWPEDCRVVLVYSVGKVFFLYAPFTGKVLDAVLDALAHQARHRPITLCTYGACTFEVATQPWLQLSCAAARHAYALAVFTSR